MTTMKLEFSSLRSSRPLVHIRAELLPGSRSRRIELSQFGFEHVDEMLGKRRVVRVRIGYPSDADGTLLPTDLDDAGRSITVAFENLIGLTLETGT